jgi:lipase chaperone LimK
MRPLGRIALGMAVVALAGTWLLWPVANVPSAPSAVAEPQPAPLRTAAPAEALDHPLAPARFERWMGAHSSLRGADLDGAWDVDAQGRLQPTIALRRRFDQLLSLSGEATLEQIGAFIEHDVRELAGADAAQRVLDVWQRYLALQRHAFQSPVSLQDRSTWGPAFAERQQVRRQVLGPELAQVFYADEERQFAALLQGAPAPAATTAVDRSQLGPEALARLQREDAAWADWERRLGAARAEMAAASKLSEPQRREAVARLLARFDAGEAVRVKALLHLD